MSIINQMLRDLDARGAPSTDFPAMQGPVRVEKNTSGMRKAGVLLLLLTVGGVSALFVLPGAKHVSGQPVTAVIAQRDPASVPVKRGVIPLIPAAPQQTVDPHSAGLDGAPASAPMPVVAVSPEMLKPPIHLAGKMARNLVLTPVVMQDPPVASTLTRSEPAVVKKMSEQTPEAEAQQYFDDAQALRRAGKTDAAIGKYRLALVRNPGMQHARLLLARLLQENGQPDAALSLLRAGYDRQPNGDLAIATGRLLVDQGQRELALSWLERGRESLRPSDQALMGALLSQGLRYEEAVTAYQHALAAEPNQGGWLLGMGMALESLGRIAEAKLAYRNALERGEFKPDVVKYLRQKINVSDL